MTGFVFGTGGGSTLSPLVNQAGSNDILSGRAAYNSEGGIVNGGIIIKSAETITPSKSQQKVSGGQYLGGDITISPIPSTYKNLTQNTTVTANNLGSGVTAYNKSGTYITGTAKFGLSDFWQLNSYYRSRLIILPSADFDLSNKKLVVSATSLSWIRVPSDNYNCISLYYDFSNDNGFAVLTDRYGEGLSSSYLSNSNINRSGANLEISLSVYQFFAFNEYAWALA